MATTVVLNIPVDQVTLAWRSPYVSESLNKKQWANSRGIIRGVTVSPGAGAREIILRIDPTSQDSVVNGGQPGQDSLLTWRTTSDIPLTLPNDPGQEYYVYFVPGYSVGATTVPQVVAYDETDFLADVPRLAGGVLICAVTIPAGATPPDAREIHYAGVTSSGKAYLREWCGLSEASNLSVGPNELMIMKQDFGPTNSQTIGSVQLAGFSGGTDITETNGSFCMVMSDGTQESGAGFLRCQKGSAEDIYQGGALVFGSASVSHHGDSIQKLRVRVRYRTSANYTSTVPLTELNTGLTMWAFPQDSRDDLNAGVSGPFIIGDLGRPTLWPSSFRTATSPGFDAGDGWSDFSTATVDWKWAVYELDLSQDLAWYVNSGQIGLLQIYFYWGFGWTTGADSYLDIDRVIITQDAGEGTATEIGSYSPHLGSAGGFGRTSQAAGDGGLGLDATLPQIGLTKSGLVGQQTLLGASEADRWFGGSIAFEYNTLQDSEAFDDWRADPFNQTRIPIATHGTEVGEVAFQFWNDASSGNPTGQFLLDGTLVRLDDCTLTLGTTGLLNPTATVFNSFGSVRFDETDPAQTFVCELDTSFQNGADVEYVSGTNVIYQSGSVLNWLDASTATGSALVVDSSNEVKRAVSTRKVKSKIVDSEFGLREVVMMDPRAFTYTNSGVERVGFIAEELAEISDKFATYGPDFEYKDGESVVGEDGSASLLSGDLVPVDIDTRALVAALVGAVKELSATVDALKAEIDELKEDK